MRMPAGLDSRSILDVRVDATSYDDATRRIVSWAGAAESRYVCVCNVHMVMEAHDDPTFRSVVNDADLVTADGMPLVWALRLLGVGHARRVYGPDLMLALCAAAERHGIPVGLHGGTPEVVERVRHRIEQLWPQLAVTYSKSPPFHPTGENPGDREDIQRSGARILFVALGCPKQERWMARNRDHLPAVMVGVGAAFDFVANTKRQAPAALQKVGLEWLFRLATEPRRLWRRYAIHNPRFVALLARQLMDSRRGL